MSRPSWFIALDAPLSLLGPEPPRNVRLLHPSDHHLTVAFFGDAGGERSLQAWAVLKRELPGAFRVHPLKCAWFGGREPRAIACEVQSASLCRWLADARPRLLQAAGCAADQRAIRPHVTVARLKHHAAAAERSAASRWLSNLEVRPKTFLLTRLALFTWTDEYIVGEPRYRRVQKATLEL